MTTTQTKKKNNSYRGDVFLVRINGKLKDVYNSISAIFEDNSLDLDLTENQAYYIFSRKKENKLIKEGLTITRQRVKTSSARRK